MRRGGFTATIFTILIWISMVCWFLVLWGVFVLGYEGEDEEDEEECDDERRNTATMPNSLLTCCSPPNRLRPPPPRLRPHPRHHDPHHQLLGRPTTSVSLFICSPLDSGRLHLPLQTSPEKTTIPFAQGPGRLMT